MQKTYEINVCEDGKGNPLVCTVSYAGELETIIIQLKPFKLEIMGKKDGNSQRI